jgi:hypothetical protein
MKYITFLLSCMFTEHIVFGFVVRLERLESLSSPVTEMQKMLYDDRKLQNEPHLDIVSKAKQSGIEITDILN